MTYASESDWPRLAKLYGRLLRRLDKVPLRVGSEEWRQHRRMLEALRDDAREHADADKAHDTYLAHRPAWPDMLRFYAWVDRGRSTQDDDYAKIKEIVR